MNKQKTSRGMPGLFDAAWKPTARHCPRRFWRRRAHHDTTTDRSEEVFSLSSPKGGEGRGQNSPSQVSRFEPQNHGAPPLPALSPALSGGEGGRRPGEEEVHGEKANAIE